MIQQHSIKVPKTAHYYTLGELQVGTKEVWLIFHGYGQLASRIINKFTSIQSTDRFFVSIEGLSRFYWGDAMSTQVAASWMTSQDRLEEIADFCHYIQTIYDDLKSKIGEDTKIILFGFSQGVATLMRWLHQNQPEFHTAILWAGGVPEDIDFLPLKSYFSNKALHFIHGTQDEFLTQKRMKFQKSVMIKNEFEVTMHSFEGKHVVDRQALIKITEALKFTE